MRCPICGNYEQRNMKMKTDQFYEDLAECSVCGSSWSINHGHAEILHDSQIASFLQGKTDCVEGDDYTWST